MKIILAAPEYDSARWIASLTQALPGSQIVCWDPIGPFVGADYALVWRPPEALFTRETGLRAVFNLGAGVDALMRLPTLPPTLPVVRLEDAGMSLQMVEYVLYALWRAARGFDEYEAAQRRSQWLRVPPIDRQDWPVGVLGLGVLGERVARAVGDFGFPVAGWVRSPREAAGFEVFAGMRALPDFLARTRVLVNLLPLTPQTAGLLNRQTFCQLLPEAYLINIARGAHLVEQDLLDCLESGRLRGATLDVFHTEPLPAGHPFWQHPAIHVTPHAAARTLYADTIAQLAAKIRSLELGQPISGVVERGRGY